MPIGIYLSPGANAVHDRRGGARRRWTKLSARFPPGMQADGACTTPPPSSRDTIHEVLTTLLEAFGLVVIVVFLFLGNVRATIIPTVAVPVSLIGTFAVLLGARLLGQYGLPARDGAGDRHRRR